jgi:sRNA-binding carbon storage regulator CsrA
VLLMLLIVTITTNVIMMNAILIPVVTTGL